MQNKIIWKNIKFDAVTTIVLYGFGFFVLKAIYKPVGQLIIVSAIAYGIATVGLPLFGFNVPSPLRTFLSAREKKNARAELLELKMLLDQNAINNDEYDAQASVLKKKIL